MKRYTLYEHKIKCAHHWRFVIAWRRFALIERNFLRNHHISLQLRSWSMRSYSIRRHITNRINFITKLSTLSHRSETQSWNSCEWVLGSLKHLNAISIRHARKFIWLFELKISACCVWLRRAIVMYRHQHEHAIRLDILLSQNIKEKLTWEETQSSCEEVSLRFSLFKPMKAKGETYHNFLDLKKEVRIVSLD